MQPWQKILLGLLALFLISVAFTSYVRERKETNEQKIPTPITNLYEGETGNVDYAV